MPVACFRTLILRAQSRFPQPKIFTNALLHSHDITALIRDTEAHERALFTLAGSDEGPRPTTSSIARRSTVHGLNGTGNNFSQSHRQRSTVATLLGGDLGEQVRKLGTKDGGERGEVDVNVLLKGAEKLCGIYPIAGAPEKITSLRSRFEQLSSSIVRYEARVAKQQAQLTKMSKRASGEYEDKDEDEDEEDDANGDAQADEFQVTQEDLDREMEEIRQLEEKKKALEDRVSGMESDLGGLLRG